MGYCWWFIAVETSTNQKWNSSKIVDAYFNIAVKIAGFEMVIENNAQIIAGLAMI